MFKSEDFRKEVISSDESNFNLLGINGCRKVWRKPEIELDRERIQYRESNIMVVLFMSKVLRLLDNLSLRFVL